MSESLGRRAVRGAMVTMAGQGGRIAIQFASVVVLSALIAPDEFGRIATIMGIVGIADVLRDFGLSSAAVQAKTLSRAQRTNLFWANTGLGAVLSTVMWFAAPAIGATYDERTGELAQILGLLFVMNGVATQFRAHLNRDLKFGALARAEVLSQLFGVAAGVAIAYADYGAWALVAQQLVAAGTAALLLWWGTRWVPGLPVRGAQMGSLLRFGAGLALSQVIGYLGNNIERVLIGRSLGMTANGVHDRGMRVVNQPLAQLRGPTTSIALPILSKLTDDPKAYGTFLVSGQVALGYTLVAGLALAAGCAQGIVALIFPPDFARVAYVMVPLAAAGGAATLSYVGYWVFLSQALSKQLLWWTTGTSIVRIIAVIAGLPAGLLAVVWVGAAVPLVAAPASVWWLGRLTPLPTAALLWGYARCAGIAALGAFAGWHACTAAMSGGESLAAAIAGIGAGGAAVVACYIAALALPWFRSDARAAISFVKLAVARKKAKPTTAG